MVAEAAKAPHEPPKTLKGDAPLKGKLGRVEVPLLSRMQVRNLYLGQCLPYKEIAAKTGLTVYQVNHIIQNDRLAVKKREKIAKLTKRTDARIDDTFQQFEDQAARECEEISLGALQKARGEVESGGEFAPKNFQAWTQGINNLVKVSRTMRGLDQPQSGANGISGNVTLNMFVVESIRDMRPLANADRSANANTPQLPQSNAIEVQAKPVE